MRRFLVMILAFSMIFGTSAFAAVECKVPPELAGGQVAPDVPMIGGAPESNESSAEAVTDTANNEIVFAPNPDGKYSSMGDLYQAWGGYVGYPDYVCGVWSTDGGLINMTVAVTENKAGEMGKEKILSMLEKTETVTFTYQTYTYEELEQVNDAIVQRMTADKSPIVACGIYEMENVVRVTVLETAEGAQAVARELSEIYGVKVVVELGNMIFTDTSMEEPRDRGMEVLLLFLFVMGIPGMVAAIKRFAKHIGAGETVTENDLTCRQTEKSSQKKA